MACGPAVGLCGWPTSPTVPSDWTLGPEPPQWTSGGRGLARRRSATRSIDEWLTLIAAVDPDRRYDVRGRQWPQHPARASSTARSATPPPVSVWLAWWRDDPPLHPKAALVRLIRDVYLGDEEPPQIGDARDDRELRRRLGVLRRPVTVLTLQGLLLPAIGSHEWERQPSVVGVGPDHTAMAVWPSTRARSDAGDPKHTGGRRNRIRDGCTHHPALAVDFVQPLPDDRLHY